MTDLEKDFLVNRDRKKRLWRITSFMIALATTAALGAAIANTKPPEEGERRIAGWYGPFQ